MAFTSSIFLFVFFPLCLGGYYLAAGVERGVAALRRLRLPDLFLVCASMVFYAWAAFDGALWLVGYVLLAFLLGRVIAGMPKGTPARLLAAGCSVLVVVLMLVYFKYYNFSVTTVNRLFSLSIATRSIVAPWASRSSPFRRCPTLWTSPAGVQSRGACSTRRCI